MARAGLTRRLDRIEQALRTPPSPDLEAEAREYGQLVSSSEWHRAYEGHQMIDGVNTVVSTLITDGGHIEQIVGVRISLM